MQENVSREGITNKSSNRSFGLVMAAFFMVVGVWPLIRGGAIRVWPVIIAMGFVLLSLMLPAVLSPLNRAWFKLGVALHHVISPIVLGLMFYVVIAPIGLVRRVFVRDPMKLRFEPAKVSYWVNREPPGPKPESFTDQF